jgi:hypothetical protein
MLQSTGIWFSNIASEHLYFFKTGLDRYRGSVDLKKGEIWLDFILVLSYKNKDIRSLKFYRCAKLISTGQILHS